MIERARQEALPRRQPRRSVFVTGVLVAALTGGAGVAVASDVLDWETWAQHPVGAYTYELPSGVVCEVRFGNVTTYTPHDRDRAQQIEDALRTWFDHSDVVDIALDEVDDYIAASRKGDHVVHLADGTAVPGGFGTEYYDADREYSRAFSQSINDQVMAEAVRLGFAEQIASYEAHGQCPGGDE